MSVTAQAQSGQAQPAPRISPVNDLVNLLIVMLTPVFLGPAGGDLRLARLGAQQALLAFKAEHHADWLTIAQIVAFGLATLNTLCLSFVEDLPIQAVLRLNNSADRLSKAEMRHRKIRQEPKDAAASQPAGSIQPTPVPAAPQPAAPPVRPQAVAAKPAPSAPAEVAVSPRTDSIQEPSTPAAAYSAASNPPKDDVAALEQMPRGASAGEAVTWTAEHAQEPRRSGPALSVVQTAEPTARQSAAWIGSAARVAGEYLAAMPDLDPVTAEQAMLRANALSEAARDVAGGGSLPAEPVFSLASDNRRLFPPA